jgi:cytoskeletal protein CcmA (bactofilin family)
MQRVPTLEAIGVRRSMVVGLLTVLVLALAPPAWAQDAQGREAFVVLSGRADVPQGQQVGDLVVFHGSSTVDGTVDGSLTAFDAPVTISGRVNGDVVVFNGRVELRSGANVTGDVVSRDAPVVASGATIGGERRRVQTNVNWKGFGWAGRLAWWLAVSVSTLVVGLVLLWLVGRGAAWILEAGRTRVGPAIGWGLLLFFGLPILAVIALVTVVGIPLGLGLLAALALIYALGYSAAAWILGRSIVRSPTAWVVAFLVGWAILRVVALVPILGGLVWFVAVVFGLGALLVAIWRGRSAAQAAPAAA